MNKIENILESDSRHLMERGFYLIQKIGEGGYSKVYKTIFKDENTLKIVACKRVNTSRTGQSYRQKFLERELNALRLIRHPNIIFIHCIYQRKNIFYIFMRYAERGDLFDYIKENGHIIEIQCIKWVKQIASAIYYLHMLDYAHRDLKCENILITNNFNVKLCDFGFTRLFTIFDKASETYCGSIIYAPPEVINSKPYNPKKADMWSFGVTIFIMLNGEHPYSTSSISTLYDEQINCNWKIVTRIFSELTEGAKDAYEMLLEPDPMSRWNIEDFINCNWMKSFPEETKFTKPEIEAINRAKKWKLRKKKQQKKDIAQLDGNEICPNDSLLTIKGLSYSENHSKEYDL